MITFKTMWLHTYVHVHVCNYNHNDHYKYPTIAVLDGTAISVFDDIMISTGPVLAHCDQSTKQIHPTSQL